MAGDLNTARGERIDSLMTAQGFSPSHLARLIGADRKLVYGWKAGKKIGSEHLERLALALGTSRRYIETGEGEEFVQRPEAPAVLIRQLADALVAAQAETAPHERTD